MLSDPTQYALTAPPTLNEALTLLAENPGQHTPLAGGTELMVALAAGRLTQKSLLSINHLPELRFIHATSESVTLGANSTFTDIRRNPTIARDLPLLIQSASWTGSIANQNRATLGGNIVNASPAADTPPALLVYNATVTLISATATRTLPYSHFHLGYKRTALQPDELLHSVSIPRIYSAHQHFIRKVGTRNAQAISKTALAAIALLQNQTIQEIRLAAASLADRPLRLHATEAALQNASLAPADFPTTLRRARAALASESHPIDDIRSTARYRSAVAANLLEQFLRALS
ncbi:MAG TPA: FAD binding domain-containing protein [Acidobacteriaceae bacterium]|jgi:CO/xanthine dehydrogenase FAD-binding subunit|nr:FAD binding domain-containing protein [Acidobacteriaceae bacterium]